MSRGAALPATLFALALTSALAIGGLYVTRRHAAAAAESNAALELRPLAERAAIDALVQWDSLARAQQPIGVTQGLSGPARTQTWITRTGELEYLVVAEARTERRPALYHRIGLSLVVSEGRPSLPFPRAWTLLP